MKAADFRYERPVSLDDALALLAQEDVDAMPLAGGQSLMPMMNFRMAQPELLIDLNGISELMGITIDDGHLKIGAMTRYSDLERAPEIAEHAPLIATALPHIAHSAIRNRGTIGGSVALADPAAEMPALLLALGAQIGVQGPQGGRWISADDFFLGVYETARDDSELVTALSIPIVQNGDRFGFYELARRHGDYAMAGVAIAHRTAFRIAFFSVSDRAVRAHKTEAILTQDPTAIDAAIAALDEIEFNADLNGSEAAKRHYAGVVLRRALEGMQS